MDTITKLERVGLIALIDKFNQQTCEGCESTFVDMICGQWTGVDIDDHLCLITDPTQLCHCEMNSSEPHITVQCACRRWTARISPGGAISGT